MNGAPAPGKTDTAIDARILKSRDALRSAFLSLLEHKNLDQISIREIAATANVGHATFYRHYPTKEALLNDLAADEMRRLIDFSLPVMDANSRQAATLAQCQYIAEHRKLWTTLLTGGAAGSLKEELLRISREIANVRPDHSQDAIPTDLRVILITSTIVETLSWWLRQETQMSTEDVATILHQGIFKYWQ